MTKISVIIPIFNVEKFVQQCLKSVVGQTCKDIEIICINDCTKDSSMKIVEEFSDDRIKIFHHKENLGLAKSRNTGLLEAKGEYIFFLDSDDFLQENILEELLKKIESTNCDIVYSETFAFAQNEENVKKAEILNRYFNSKLMPKYFEINKNNFQKSLSYYPVVAWGKLYRTSFLKENCVQFVDKNIIHEDDGFYIKTMSLYPKIACVEGVGVNYRIRNNSIMNELCEDKNKKDLIISLNDAFDFINDKRVVKKVKNSKIYSKYFNVWKKTYCCLKEFLTKR